MRSTPVCFSVDAEDVIVEVSAGWEDFARANGAPDLTRERVTGRCLWDFVCGDETRELYRAIFEKVRRDDVALIVPFRCDSPECFRFMQMVVSHRKDATLRCRSTLVREQARPYFPFLDRAFPRSESSLPVCSLCKRVLVFEAEWLEPEDAIARLDLFASPQLPSLEHCVCEACRRRCTDGEEAASPPH